MKIIEKNKDANTGIITYIIAKIIPDNKISSYRGKFVKSRQIDTIIDHDADVYFLRNDKERNDEERNDEERNEGEEKCLLLSFRKKVLSKENIDAFSHNVEIVAKKKTRNRAVTSGDSSYHLDKNKDVQTNIFGYMDSWTPGQKHLFKRQGLTAREYPVGVRKTWFNTNYPDRFAKTMPLIREINKMYQTLVPDKYRKQHKKALETPFHLRGTAFTTVTTNLNYQTAIHKDRGDDDEGFGNLTVIERGRYEGGETCFPQFGIGVDVREGDVLFMDSHQWHGNLAIKKKGKDAERLSIVCYLRTKIWELTKGKTRKYYETHNRRVHYLLHAIGNRVKGTRKIRYNKQKMN